MHLMDGFQDSSKEISFHSDELQTSLLFKMINCCRHRSYNHNHKIQS